MSNDNLENYRKSLKRISEGIAELLDAGCPPKAEFSKLRKEALRDFFSGVVTMFDILPDDFRLDDFKSLVQTLEKYKSKNKVAQQIFKIPKNQSHFLARKNIKYFSDIIDSFKKAVRILQGTTTPLQKIKKYLYQKTGTVSVQINFPKTEKRPDLPVEICNSILRVSEEELIEKLDSLSLEGIKEETDKQLEEFNKVDNIIGKNQGIKLKSIKEALFAINANIFNREVQKEVEKIDQEIFPFFIDISNLDKKENCYQRLIDLFNSTDDLSELLSRTNKFDAISLANIDADAIERFQDWLNNNTRLTEYFSNSFFVIHPGEDFEKWRQHIFSLVDYNNADEFDLLIRQNEFIKALKTTLTERNEKIVDSYIDDPDITYAEFCEYLTSAMIESIYGSIPASARKKIDKDYFSNFKQEQKKLRIKTYFNGLEKLKLKFEDPAKVLSYNSEWTKAKTNIERIRKNSGMIVDAFPVVIATPADVSKYISDKKEMFDYVVFDEASQLLPGQALPSIYRSKKAVIVGDPHQMPPTSTIEIGFDTGEETDPEDLDISILDLAIKLQLDATYHLKVHYRSESNKLFEPSRQTIYAEDGVSPIFEATSRDVPIFIADSLGEDNDVGFSKIVQRVDYYLSKNKKATFCILFSRKDKLGRRGFMKYLEENQAQSRLIMPLYEEGRILISTVTECQGIEGDHSIVYLPHYSSPRSMWFFKESAGAYKRLNVSITRQRCTLDVIMGDPRGTWLQTCQNFLEDPNSGPNQQKSAKLLSALLSGAGQEVDENYLEELLGPNALDIDSPLTQQLYDRLVDHYEERIGKDLKIWCEVGWNMLLPDAEAINKNNRNVGYRIDIGIYDIHKRHFILGIEMDGATYHSGFSKEFSDLQRQEVLERKGWNIYRIWSTNWLHDTDREFSKLIAKIDDELSKVEEEVTLDYDVSDIEQEEESLRPELSTQERDNSDEIIDGGEENEGKEEVFRPEEGDAVKEFEAELAGKLEECAKFAIPIEMKYSNVPLSSTQKKMSPIVKLFIKVVNRKEGFFLGSFELKSSPYKIKFSDVFEYVANTPKENKS